MTVVAALMHLGCFGHARTPGRPDVFLHLGQADQVCTRGWRDPTATIDVFVNLINLPPQDVKIVVDEKFVFWMRGDSLQLSLKRVGIGAHKVEVFVAFRKEPYTKVFSVWDCRKPEEIQ